jgi:hypothetical protein
MVRPTCTPRRPVGRTCGSHVVDPLTPRVVDPARPVDLMPPTVYRGTRPVTAGPEPAIPSPGA